ncbi:MAG: hypothetical protein WAN99_06825 [Methanoculleus sp.]
MVIILTDVSKWSSRLLGRVQTRVQIWIPGTSPVVRLERDNGTHALLVPVVVLPPPINLTITADDPAAAPLQPSPPESRSSARIRLSNSSSCASIRRSVRQIYFTSRFVS